MIKCPYCGHGNEDGTLFCEQCKSDLGALAENVPVADPLETFAAETGISKQADPTGENPVAPPAPEATPEPAAAASSSPSLPPGSQPKLVVIRGTRINSEYPLYEGENYIGRTDEKPVDIDLEDQEPPDRIWSSRQHACIVLQNGSMTIEDLNSSNGTFVNRTRVYPNQKRDLQIGDIIQIGTVQLKVRA
ncbi:MAG TPA: FHA domain-containing protein [Gemmatales bacterium]|nr:FHA domain-containing protein [Gemmatales bacterium]HMP60286.1 FHA domain-containing protein [Gemmatales bacterium]